MQLQALACYQKYDHLYVLERKATIAEFQQANLHFSDYESEMERYEKLEAEIMELSPSQYLNAAIQLSTEPLKFALAVEAKAWKTAYGRSLNDRYRTCMESTVHFVTEYSKKLSRPIKVGTDFTQLDITLVFTFPGFGGRAQHNESP